MEKISWKVVSGLICVTIILYGLLIHSFLNSLSPTNRTYPSTNQSTNQNPQQIINRTFSFKAAIIDQLSISDPDPFFIKAATYILEMANFTVKYYPREQVMIELYKDLATYDYGLIIFRVHSGREPVTFFFSGEPYNTTEYFPEQWNDQIGQCQVPDETLTHFSIRPLFVKYYPREQVMIELYKDLATYDYGLIIFRVHSGREPVTFFFSGEPYNTTEYFPEQWNDQIGQCQVPDETLTHFSIRPLFVKYAMKGSFYKTVIIAMGCASLRTTEMAQAFIEKGAAAYIGWNASLTAFYGDLATLSVIKHLLLENQTVEEAVDAAMIEVGPCPTNKSGTTSILSVYPSSSQNYTIPYVADGSQTP
jgi:hypothetical protein